MRTRPFNTILIFLFSAYIQYGFSQFNPYYNFKHLNVENGLVQNIVYHFLQDSRGYMWLGTRNGITVYDGIRTINFQHDEKNKETLGGNFITRILEDSDHLIWIGNDAGIDLYNRADNNFTHFGITMNDGHTEDGYSVLLGFSKRYELWYIDTKSKAIRIFNTKTKKTKLVIQTDAVDGMLYVNPVTGAVHIWSYLSIGTTHYIFQKDSLFLQENFFKNEKDGAEPSEIFHVFYQNDTTAWLSAAKGLIELNPVSHKYQLYNNMGNEPVIEVRYSTLSPRGMLWVSTGGHGVLTFDTKTKKFVDNFRNYLTDPFSICNNNIVSLYFDKVGNIWCGSYGNGVSYANVETRFFSKYLSKDEMDHWKKENNVFWVGEDLNGNIWCILQDVRGFWKLDSTLGVKEFRKTILENGEPFHGSIYQLHFYSKTSAWCLTDRGLFRYNIATNRMKQVDYHRLSDDLFGSYWTNIMMKLHDGSFLFSTMGGLYRINGNEEHEIIQPFSELNNLPFRSFDMIYEDHENNIYVKDIGNNLYVLGKSGGDKDYRIKKKIDFTGNIIQYYEYGTSIYIGSNQGLFILNKSNFAIEKPPVNETLPFTGINNVLVEKNKIWLFGDRGLYYYNIQEKTGRLFTDEDGLPSNKFNETSMVLTSGGKCIAGTKNGLVSFYPEKLVDIIYPPRAQLINMYVNDSAGSFIANPQETSKVDLEYYQNTFSFDFSCIGFQHAALSLYEYKLDGNDEKWIRSGTTHYTRYSKMPPGKYSFHLRTLDAKGQVSPYMKTLNIEIKKAFWQTNIFRVIMAALLGFLIWLAIKWYLTTRIRAQQREFEKQQAVEKERTRIATDMHDDLGAGLSSIRFISEKVKRDSISNVTKNDIDKILVSSSELIDKMNEIVWAMNEKNDSLGDLLFYIRSYAMEYCEEHGIQCGIKLPENIPDIFVSGEIRRNVFLTIKESLHNVVKHSEATSVDIDFQSISGLFAMIRDNGKGIGSLEIRKGKGGNGLRNMRKRIESIGGIFKMYNREGMVIEISVPLGV